MIDKYISRVEEVCGEEKGYIVLLKRKYRDEIIENILSKGRVVKSISNILMNVEYEGKSVDVFRTGKLVFKGIESRSELENMLSKLLA